MQRGEDISAQRHPGGKRDVERRDGKHIEGRTCGGDSHPGVRPEPFAQRSEAVPGEARRRLDPHREVARRIGEQVRDRRHHALRRGVPGLHGHRMARHREDPARRDRTDSGVRDQLGELRALARLVPRLAFPALRPAPLVPGERGAHRHQQPAPHLHPVGELGVLPAIAVEGLVEAAHFLEEGPGDREIVPGHGPEKVVMPGGQLPGPGQVALRPGRVEGPIREQRPERARPVADRAGIDARRRHLRAKAQRQRVGDRVMPTRMGRQQARFGDHVPVEEDQDAVRRRSRPGIARPCQPEAAPVLAHHPNFERGRVERGRGRPRERRLGAIVDDDDLEQLPGIVLPFQPRQRQHQRSGRLEAGHDDADRQRRREACALGQSHPPPVVAAHRGRERPRHGLTSPLRCRPHGTVRSTWPSPPHPLAGAALAHVHASTIRRTRHRPRSPARREPALSA